MLRIGQLAGLTGTKVPTIRFYEERGLLPEPTRNAGNQRLYGKAHVERLTFIRHARALGFSLEAVAALLDLGDHPERPCNAADRIAREQLEAVEQKIARLSALKRELTRMLESCHRGRIADCRVIEALSEEQETAARP